MHCAVWCAVRSATACCAVHSATGCAQLRSASAHPGALPQVDHAYHGHTSVCIDLSPYKWKGPGGGGRPAHVHVLPCPDGAPAGMYVAAHCGCLPQRVGVPPFSLAAQQG